MRQNDEVLAELMAEHSALKNELGELLTVAGWIPMFCGEHFDFIRRDGRRRT